MSILQLLDQVPILDHLSGRDLRRFHQASTAAAVSANRCWVHLLDHKRTALEGEVQHFRVVVSACDHPDRAYFIRTLEAKERALLRCIHLLERSRGL